MAIGGMGVNIFAEEDDAVVQETRIDVVWTFATIGGFDYGWDEIIICELSGHITPLFINFR